MLTHTLLILAAALPGAEPAPLAEGVTSLGATVADDTLYIYGGHLGTAHHYNSESQSNKLSALDLDKPTAWKTASTGPRLQSIELVSYDGKVYRIGGFAARNHEGEKADLHSVANVDVFDPETGKWTELTDLPEPRSSFDADMMGSHVYVIGGWTLSGKGGDAQWLKTAWTADLSKRPIKWEAITPPPFQRRAVAVAAYEDEIYVIGGMGDEGATRKVAIYNPKTKKWRDGPALIGDEGLDGFGAAAVGTDSGLYVTSLTRTAQRLTKGADKWEVVADLKMPRFFHQMVLHDGELWLVGGANMVVGKLPKLEIVDLQSDVSTDESND